MMGFNQPPFHQPFQCKPGDLVRFLGILRGRGQTDSSYWQRALVVPIDSDTSGGAR